MCYLVDAVEIYIADIWEVILGKSEEARSFRLVMQFWPTTRPSSVCHEMMLTAHCCLLSEVLHRLAVKMRAPPYMCTRISDAKQPTADQIHEFLNLPDCCARGIEPLRKFATRATPGQSKEELAAVVINCWDHQVSPATICVEKMHSEQKYTGRKSADRQPSSFARQACDSTIRGVRFLYYERGGRCLGQPSAKVKAAFAKALSRRGTIYSRKGQYGNPMWTYVSEKMAKACHNLNANIHC